MRPVAHILPDEPRPDAVLSVAATAPLPGPVAYCAPGKRSLAAIALALGGHEVEKITEHAWLEGSADVILINRLPELIPDPEAFKAVQ